MTNPQCPHHRREKPVGKRQPEQEQSRHMNHGGTALPKKKMEIDIDIDLPDKVILELALMAHNRGMTLNDLCIEIIKDKLASINVTPEECPHDEADRCPDGSFACVECGKHVEII
jgi:hypothetical protein